MANNELTEYIIKKNTKKEKDLKYDFMPSIIEIIERPAHISSKVIIVAIFALMVVCAVWMYCADLDVIVEGQGAISTSTDACVIVSESTGIIDELHVSTGDYVKAGDVLAKLDSSSIALSIEQINSKIDILNKQKEIVEIYLADTKAIVDINAYNEKYKYDIQNLIYENQIYNRQKENTIYVSDTLDIEYSASLNNRIVTINEAISDYEYELAMQQLLLDRTIIEAGISGYILSANVSYVGETVNSQKELFVIIPEDTAFIFKGYISDSDISDISVGSVADIKLKAYPYSDYGSIKGMVSYISPSSVSIDGLGTVYMVEVTIDNSNINENISLVSGLSGTMEIRIGTRSVLDYFLEPIKKGVNNSLKEK